MKIKSDVSVDLIQFYTYGHDEKNELDFIGRFPFDNRQDFLVAPGFSGIAVKIELSSNCYDKDVSRTLSFSLIDMTSRCEVAAHEVKVNILKDELFKDEFICFALETVDLRRNHTYKLVVSNDTAQLTLAESIFHLFDSETFNHPSEWYEVSDCGVRPAWTDDLYKSLDTIDGHDYYVRFNLAQRFGTLPPKIMPELELRLHYPEGIRITADFREPKCCGVEEYKSNNWFVEFPFTTLGEINGVFYAELLCMEYPVAGFEFCTAGPDERGSRFGHDIEPRDY